MNDEELAARLRAREELFKYELSRAKWNWFVIGSITTSVVTTLVRSLFS